MNTRLIRVAFVGVTLALATPSATLVAAQPAFAGQYHVYGCRDPHTGAIVATDGWSAGTNGAAWEYYGNSCSAGGNGAYLYAALGGNVNHNYGDYAQQVFSAPSGTTLTKFTLWRYATSASGQAYGAPGTMIGSGATVVDQCNLTAYGCSSWGDPNNPLTANNAVGTSGLSNTSAFASASCGGGPGGVCPADGASFKAAVYVYASDIVLQDTTNPSASNITGPLVSGTTQRGVSDVLFNASDTGSGVYSGIVSIDGTPVYSQIIDNNGGACQDIGDSGDGLHAFQYAVPCKLSASADVTFDTSAVTDGTHTLRVSVTDAAGNSSPVYVGSLTTHNAPVQTGAPSATGSTIVGQMLSGIDGTFSAPSGAGTTTITRSWQRCDANGNNCQTIAGANTATYSPTASDIGETLRFANVAANNDGSTTVVSNQTAPVTNPASGGAISIPNDPTPTSGGDANPGIGGATTTVVQLPPGVVRLDSKWSKYLRGLKRRYPQSAVTLTGTLRSTDGKPLAGQVVQLLAHPGLNPATPLQTLAQATTDGSGRWSLRAPNGPSRLIRVAYGNQVEAQAAGTQLTKDIAERVTPVLQLHVSSPGGGRLVFAGSLKFGPLGSPPPLVLVQARKGRSWQTVGSPIRVGANGRFRGAYLAPSRIVGHSFTFRAMTPATAINETGASRPVTARLR